MAPTVPETRPASQGVHVVVPNVAEKVPDTHGMQLVAAAPEKVPTLQAKQAPEIATPVATE